MVVVNGEKLEDKAFPIPAGEQPPTNLTGKLLIFKLYFGFWYQTKNKISNLNIFSKRMTLSEMVSRTAGDDCGKADGDYLAWERAEWDLRGKASLGEVTVEELCRRETKIQVFTSPISGLEKCNNLCRKIQKGTMATIRSPSETQDFLNRVDEVLFTNGERTQAASTSNSAWAAIHKGDDGSWIDLYNKEPVKEIVWAKGHPQSNPIDRCAIYVVPWKGLASYACMVNPKLNPNYCPCYFSVHPYLTLRGLCSDSYIDHVYLARNDPVTGYLFFYGDVKTVAQFDGKNWKMLTAFYNTSALTDAKPDTFILGKHVWSISGDSEECHSGKPYTTE